MDIERQRYNMQVDQQINAQKRQIDDIQRKINEQREYDRKLADKEDEFKEAQENFPINNLNSQSKQQKQNSNLGGKADEVKPPIKPNQFDFDSIEDAEAS